MGTSQQFSFQFSNSELIDSFSRTLIVVIFFSGFPAKIIRAVAFVVVCTPKSMFGCGRFAYISQKFYEIMPAFAYFYSTPSIVFELFVVWIAAAIMHARPPRKKWVHHSMSSVSMTSHTAMGASTRFSLTTLKRVSGNRTFTPAITTAKPISISTFRVCSLFNDKPSTKTLTGDIFEFGHNDLHERLLRQVARVTLVASPRCAF